MFCFGTGAGRELGYESAAPLDDCLRQFLVSTRIDAIQPGGRYGYGDTVRFERAGMRGSIDSQCESAGDGETGGNQTSGEVSRDSPARW